MASAAKADGMSDLRFTFTELAMVQLLTASRSSRWKSRSSWLLLTVVALVNLGLILKCIRPQTAHSHFLLAIHIIWRRLVNQKTNLRIIYMMFVTDIVNYEAM